MNSHQIDFFRQKFETRLGDLFVRANDLFQKLGDAWAIDVIDTLNHGIRLKKTEEVIEALEKYEKKMTKKDREAKPSIKTKGGKMLIGLLRKIGADHSTCKL